MGRYRKLPIEVEADVYTLGMEDGLMTSGEAIINGWKNKSYVHPACAKFKGIPYIETLEGYHFISEGDYIITGVESERYPCKKGIFEKTYELII